jgi:radical SAM superfamily enzyme YgiQ (UPF0313 family)
MPSTFYDCVLFTDGSEDGLIHKPIGAYKIANQIRKMGFTCLVVDHLGKFNRDELIDIIDLCISNKTKLVGFSNTFIKTERGVTITHDSVADGVFFPQGLEFQNSVLSYIKNIAGNAKLVVGGAKTHASYDCDQIDYLVIGYAESAIVNIMGHITSDESLQYATKNSRNITVIDNRKSIGYDIVNDFMEWQPIDIVNAKVLPFELSRGCIFKCKFCAYPFTGRKTFDYVKSPEAITTELQRNYDEYGIKYYWLVEDTFNDNEKKIDLFLSAVKKLTFQPIFKSYLRLDLIATKFDTFEKIYESGMRSGFFGIETLDDHTGKLIGKGYSREKQIDALKRIKKEYPDFDTHGNFIVGLPTETEESLERTARLLSTGEIPLDFYMFSPLILINPGVYPWSSDIDNNPEKYGYEITHKSNDGFYQYWKSDIMNYYRAYELATKFNSTYKPDATKKLFGRRIWDMLNYSGMSFERLNKMSPEAYLKQYQRFEIQKKRFITDYKTGLRKHLNEI